METVREVCEFISNLIDDAPICIETGCTYCAGEECLIHTTTNNIIDIICRKNYGYLYSLDIDEEHISLAQIMCGNDKNPSAVPVSFMLGDSVESMKKLGESLYGVSLLWLDSKEFDEDHMVNEFLAIQHRLAEKHFVMVDDIHNQNSVKWVKMVPMLKDLGYSFFEVPTPTGLFVSALGYDISNNE